MLVPQNVALVQCHRHAVLSPLAMLLAHAVLPPCFLACCLQVEVRFNEKRLTLKTTELANEDLEKYHKVCSLTL